MLHTGHTCCRCPGADDNRAHQIESQLSRVMERRTSEIRRKLEATGRHGTGP